MSRLPPALQPAWPLLKRLHRLLALVAGVLFRRVSPLLGERGLPRDATTSSADTARREPGAVTLHPAGPAEAIRRGRPVGEPPRHWVFEQRAAAEIPPRYVLEVRGGTVTGDFGAASTPGKLLDYQTSGYFGLAGWREHPLFLRPDLGRVEHVDGTLLSLAARGAATNYYHFLYDAIGRYGILEEALPGERPDAVVIPHQTGYQRQLIAMVGLDLPLLQPRPRHTFRADRLLVPSTPNQDLDAPRSTVEWLRKRLPPRSTGDGPRRLYLSRGQQPGSRRYLQEPALWPALERRGFVVLDPGKLSVQEQIDVFHGAEVVVAPHGAALTNITFGSPGLRVLELFAPTYVHLGLWAIAEAVDGIEYRYLVGDGPTREGRPMTGILDDISIPADRVEAAVDELLA